MTTRAMTIGEVANRAGVATSTLRFYEDVGLVNSTRNSSGHRRYSPDVLRRIAFIRAAQTVGLSLDEIANALGSLPDSRTPTASDWERLSGRWTARLDRQIELLVQLRDSLGDCIRCGCLSLESCRIWNPDDRSAADGPGSRLQRPSTTSNHPDSQRPHDHSVTSDDPPVNEQSRIEHTNDEHKNSDHASNDGPNGAGRQTATSPTAGVATTPSVNSLGANGPAAGRRRTRALGSNPTRNDTTSLS